MARKKRGHPSRSLTQGYRYLGIHWLDEKLQSMNLPPNWRQTSHKCSSPNCVWLAKIRIIWNDKSKSFHCYKCGVEKYYKHKDSIYEIEKRHRWEE